MRSRTAAASASSLPSSSAERLVSCVTYGSTRKEQSSNSRERAWDAFTSIFIVQVCIALAAEVQADAIRGEAMMSEQQRQESGQREQGTRTEHPTDLSSPQLTDPVEES